MDFARTSLMGVLNVTPDSFSDGAKFLKPEAAINRATQMVRDGATVIDVGGESTRPGATLIGAAAEKARVIPVVSALTRSGLTVSIDTIRAETAKEAVQAGARIVNDVSGGTFDAEMYATVAALAKTFDLKYIIGHWRGVPDPNNSRSEYQNVVQEVATALQQQTRNAIAAGIPKENIIIDPGLGFDKNTQQSWQILREIESLKNLGFPVCIGVSRKRMLGDIVFKTTGTQGEFKERDLPTAVVTAFAARAGVELVRVHEVLGSAQALQVEKLWAEKNTHTGPTTSQQSDTITLTGLEVFAHHGVFDFERKNGQLFLIDIEVVTDMRSAISGDELAETVHYGELAEKVVQAVQKNPVDLIETVAERVAGVALSFRAAKEVQVTVHKPDAPIPAKFADVAVSIRRKKAAR